MQPNLIHDGQLDRPETAEALRRFLESTVRAAGLDLKVKVQAIEPDGDNATGDAEVLADLDGKDKEILLERGAEVLKALEHLAYRALRLEPEWHEKIHIDCGGYRALRFEELRMTARVAAERVQATQQPFRLNPMSSRERRIVHMALKDVAGVRTESVGVGDKRQVVIHPAGAASPAKRAGTPPSPKSQ
jgi:spoIIIJ-associated protein